VGELPYYMELVGMERIWLLRGFAEGVLWRWVTQQYSGRWCSLWNYVYGIRSWSSIYKVAISQINCATEKWNFDGTDPWKHWHSYSKINEQKF